MLLNWSTLKKGKSAGEKYREFNFRNCAKRHEPSVGSRLDCQLGHRGSAAHLVRAFRTETCRPGAEDLALQDSGRETSSDGREARNHREIALSECAHSGVRPAGDGRAGQEADEGLGHLDHDHRRDPPHEQLAQRPGGAGLLEPD